MTRALAASPLAAIASAHATRRFLHAALAASRRADLRSPTPPDPLMGPGVSRELAAERSATCSRRSLRRRLSVVARDTAHGSIAISFTAKRARDVILDFRGPRLAEVRVNGAAAPTEFNGAHLRIPASRDSRGRERGDGDVHDADRARRREHHPLSRRQGRRGLPLHAARPVRRESALSLLRSARPQGAPHARAHRAARPGTRSRTASRERVDTAAAAAHVPLPRNRSAPDVSVRVRRRVRGTSVTGGPRTTHLWVRASRASEVEVGFAANAGRVALSGRSRSTSACRIRSSNSSTCSRRRFRSAAWSIRASRCSTRNRSSTASRRRSTSDSAGARRSTTRSRTSGSATTSRCSGSTTSGSRKASPPTWRRRCRTLEPDSPNPWMSFYLRNKPAAYDVDQTSGTTPVWQQLANLDQAKSNYGAIVYNKAPGILKQLNYLVGDSRLSRRACTISSSTHAYGNATWQDLLASIGKAAHRSLDRVGTTVHPAAGHAGARAAARDRERQDQAARADSASGAAAVRPRRLADAHRGRALVGTARRPRRFPSRFAPRRRSSPRRRAAGAGLRVRERERQRVRPRDARRPKRALARRAHRRGARSVPARDAVGRDVGSRARRAARAGASSSRRRLRELPDERDEQIAAGSLGRLSRATSSLSVRRAARAHGAGRRGCSCSPARRTQRAATAFARTISTRTSRSRDAGGALARLAAWLDSASTAGTAAAPADALVDRHASDRARRADADALFAAEMRRDTTANGKRSAFVAGAARPPAAVEGRVLRSILPRLDAQRRLGDGEPPRVQRAGSSGADARLSSSRRSTALPWIQKNRRIFFLGSWLGGFIGGQQIAGGARRDRRLPRAASDAAARPATEDPADARRSRAHGEIGEIRAAFAPSA